MNEKKKIRVRYRLSVLFFGAVLIFGLVFYRYMKTVSLEDVLSQDRQITFFDHSKKDSDEQPEGGEESPEEGDGADAAAAEIVNPIPESEAAEESYLSDCVFIGDALTFGLGSYGVIPSSNVLASVSLSVMNIDTEEVDTQFGATTVIDALGQIMPKNIYVMLGSTGAAYTSAADMYANYQSFLNKVRIACPDARVYIISTPPVTSGKENSAESPIKNADIDDLNTRLLGYADNNSVCYLDLNSAFKDESGCLKSDYAENDGMHLKYSAYTAFKDYILTHVVK